MAKIDLLKAAYLDGLTEAVKENPQDYKWHPSRSVETVVEKTFSVIEQDGIYAVSITNSPGWKKACKSLGIKCTYKAIRDWINS